MQIKFALNFITTLQECEFNFPDLACKQFEQQLNTKPKLDFCNFII